MGKKRIGNFRSSILGGFNRRDVVGYIEQLHKNINELQAENELLRSKFSADDLGDMGKTTQLGELQNSSLDMGLGGQERSPEPELADTEAMSDPEPDLDGVEQKSEPDIPETSLNEKLEEEPEEESAVSSEQVLREPSAPPVTKITPVPNRVEQRIGKHIDVPVASKKSKNTVHPVSKNNVKVRKKSRN